MLTRYDLLEQRVQLYALAAAGRDDRALYYYSSADEGCATAARGVALSLAQQGERWLSRAILGEVRRG